MKTKAAPLKKIDKKTLSDQNNLRKYPELKTDGPLSEKDEVKKAEDRLNRPLKEHL